MDITRWPTEIRLIIFFAAKDGAALYSQQKQDRELTVAQNMNLYCKIHIKLKKVGKTTRPFKYDLTLAPTLTLTLTLTLMIIQWK